MSFLWNVTVTRMLKDQLKDPPCNSGQTSIIVLSIKSWCLQKPPHHFSSVGLTEKLCLQGSTSGGGPASGGLFSSSIKIPRTAQLHSGGSCTPPPNSQDERKRGVNVTPRVWNRSVMAPLPATWKTELLMELFAIRFTIFNNFCCGFFFSVLQWKKGAESSVWGWQNRNFMVLFTPAVSNRNRLVWRNVKVPAEARREIWTEMF